MELLPDTSVRQSDAAPHLSPRGRAGNALLLLSIFFLACMEIPLAFGQNPDAANGDALSREFNQSAISAMVSIHQAKDHMATVISKNLPGAFYDPGLAAEAYEKVRMAEVSATTTGDQQTASLLTSYFTKIKNWADKYKADRQNMNATRTMTHDLLAKDSEWQSIEACEKALNTLLVNRTYAPIGSCQ
jgi:hypothetical protein